MTASAATAQLASGAGVLRRMCLSEYLVLWLSVVYVAALGPFTPGFFTADNFGNILATLLPLFILALGQTFVLIAGGIDLSVTSVIALTSVIGAMAMSEENGWLAGSP
jgi:ribose transport system permease protein